MLLLLIFIIFRLVSYIFGAVVVVAVVVVGRSVVFCLFVFGVQNTHINVLDTVNFGFRPTLSYLLHYILYCICNSQKHIPLCVRLSVLDVLRSASSYCLVKFSFFSGWIILWGIAKSFHSFFRSLKADAKLLLLLFVAFFVLFVLFCFVVVILFFSFFLFFFFLSFFACKDKLSKLKAWKSCTQMKTVQLQYAYNYMARRLCQERGMRI